MSDGMSDIYRSQRQFDDKAREKYGHFSKEALISLSRANTLKLQVLKEQSREITSALRAAEEEKDMLWSALMVHHYV